MAKRNLVNDLDWMMTAPSDHAQELEIAVHALERAIEAEKLNKGLGEMLKTALWNLKVSRSKLRLGEKLSHQEERDLDVFISMAQDAVDRRL